MSEHDLQRLTTTDFARAVADARLAILLPVGSVEPHGPHLGLLTDTLISQACAARAVPRLAALGIAARIAPAVPYGVTECATGFAGAISVPGAVLTEFLAAVVRGFLDNGAAHVCLVNNHLEPDQYAAVLAAARRFEPARCSVACPLARRWARTLSDEFKRGECHAGRYETALMLACAPDTVRAEVQARLPELPISLSDQLKAGVRRFTDMGMADAYAGAPAQATAGEGEALLDALASMIVTEVSEALGGT